MSEFQKSNINIKTSKPCTGCGVCSTVCPTNSIDLAVDDLGFIVACAKDETCVDCGRCMTVCSKYCDVSAKEPDETAECYSAFCRDDIIRAQSSSGGVAPLLSKMYIELGYNICGAVYNVKKQNVIHKLIGSTEQISEISGSKYLQSFTQEAFGQLKTKGNILVFATPCQIFGLRQRLRLEGREDHFVLVDFFCHGVPSYLLWGQYLKFIENKKKTGDVESVSFRDKTTGWHDYSMSIKGDQGVYKKNMRRDLFYNLYLSNSCLGKACYECQFRKGNSGSDIRLGDFWGSEYADDEKGVSIIVANTVKGTEAVERLTTKMVIAKKGRDAIFKAQNLNNIVVPRERQDVLRLLQSNTDLHKIYKMIYRKAVLVNNFKFTVAKMLPSKQRKMIKKFLKINAD